MTNRLFVRPSSLASRPLYTRTTLPGIWHYRLSPFSTRASVSSKIPSAPRQTRFPNYLLQGVSDTSSFEKRKLMVESSFASILERLDIFYIDPQSNTLARQGFFEQLDRVVWKMDPEAKVYLSGGNIRNLFGYLYEEIRFAQNKTTDQILKGILSKEFAFRDETNGKIPKMAALGVGSDLDFLIEFSPDFNAEKKRAVIDAVYEFINRVGKGVKPSLIKRTLLPVPDVNEYGVQMQRATRQGGSPLDWLAFPITRRSGSELRTPSHLPDLVDKILKGDLDFFPTTHAEDPEVTTARLFRSIIEVPYLQITEESYEELERSVHCLGQSSSSVLKKVSYVFERAMQNIRLPEASNRFVVPEEDDKVATILHRAVRNLPLKEKRLPVLPEILPQKSIEERSLDHDPGDLRKNGLLMPLDTFLAKYTDYGILYHGTPNKDAMLPMLRGSLVVSTDQQDRPQGNAVFGRGFYSTKYKKVAEGYSGEGGAVIALQVNTSPQLRVINCEKIPLREIEEAKIQNKDLHEYLSTQYDIDVIIVDDDVAVIQNANAFRIERTVEQNAPLFFGIACSIGSMELIQLSLVQNTISERDIEKAIFNASINNHKELVEVLLNSGLVTGELCRSAFVCAATLGHKEIVEMLLKSGLISDYSHDDTFLCAVQNGHKEIVEMLLERMLKKGPIHSKYLRDAIEKASRKGYQEIVEILLEIRPISNTFFEVALMGAAYSGHKEIVEMVLKRGTISDQSRGNAFIGGAYSGRKEIIEMLLKSGRISEEFRGEALWNAYQYDRKEIVEMILESGTITDEFRSKIIEIAAFRKDTYILAVMLKG